MVLVQPLGYKMVPTMAIICWALFTIEEVGHIIEVRCPSMSVVTRSDCANGWLPPVAFLSTCARQL